MAPWRLRSIRPKQVRSGFWAKQNLGPAGPGPRRVAGWFGTRGQGSGDDDAIPASAAHDSGFTVLGFRISISSSVVAQRMSSK